MRALTRWLPTRMMSQLAWLMIAALLLANLAAVAATQLLGNLLTPATRNIAVERVVLAFHESQAQHNFTLTRADGARFWLATQPNVTELAMRPEELRLRDALMQQLALAKSAALLQLESADGSLARRHIFSAARHDPLRLRASIALPDGRFFNSVQAVMPAYEWTQLLSFSLPIVTVPLLLLSLYFIYRVVRPIRRLASAADAMSRGNWNAALPVSGPQESRELTQAFNLMQLRLARHIDSRTRMLAAMSHDLNTPITELRLQVELMPAGEARNDMLESLNDLRAMVSETLHFIRGDVQHELAQRCDLSQLLTDLTRRYQQQAKTVRWQGDVGVMLMCRPLAIKRALSNLIENALHYGGDAQVTLSKLPGMVQIEVLDHGAGMAADQLAQACEPFVRFSNAPRAEHGGGLGLGLAITQSTVHAHGGELILENRPPAGLAVTLLLPDGIRS